MSGPGRFRPLGKTEWTVRPRMTKTDPLRAFGGLGYSGPLANLLQPIRALLGKLLTRKPGRCRCPTNLRTG